MWFFLAPLVVGAVVLMAAAVWPPTALQWALLLAGPALLTTCVLGALGSTGAAAVYVVVPLAYLLVPATLSWRRPWARWAVPAVTLGAAVVWYGRLASAPATRPVYVTVVAALAVVAVARAVARPSPSDGVRGAAGPRTERATWQVEPHWAPAARSAVAGVAAFQVLVGALLVVAGLALPSWAWRLTDSATTSGTLGAAGLTLVVVGALAVPLFAGLAFGLNRGYRQHRTVLVVAQLVLAVAPVLVVQEPWVVVPLGWGLATAALALVTPPPPWGESDEPYDTAAPRAAVS